MGNIFNFGRSIAGNMQEDQSAEAMKQKAESFKLVGLGGFLSVVKYAVFGVLASLNVHLFVTTVPGPFGKLIGLMAILFECFAVYCWNNGSRSAGAHRTALWVFAILFTGISCIHATAALYEIMGMADRLPWLYFYSHYVAFPLIFGLMIVGVCTLYLLHWQTHIAAAQAAAKQQIARSEAELVAESVNLDHLSKVERARLDFFKKKTLIEAGYVEAVKDYARVMAEGETVIQSIANPDIKRQLLGVLGRLGDGAAPNRRINPLPASASNTEDLSGK